MKSIPLKAYHSYEEADQAAQNDCLALKPVKRLGAVNTLRRRLFAMKGIKADNKVRRILTFGKR